MTPVLIRKWTEYIFSVPPPPLPFLLQTCSIQVKIVLQLVPNMLPTACENIRQNVCMYSGITTENVIATALACGRNLVGTASTCRQPASTSCTSHFAGLRPAPAVQVTSRSPGQHQLYKSLHGAPASTSCTSHSRSPGQQQLYKSFAEPRPAPAVQVTSQSPGQHLLYKSIRGAPASTSCTSTAPAVQVTSRSTDLYGQ